MSIPYQSVLDEDERNTSGAFFRVLPVDGETFVGALLLIDARGEPLEFTYNRVSVKHRLLWRERDLHSGVTRELLTSLLDTCPRSPSAIFCLAREVSSELFADDLDIQRPVARIAADNEIFPIAAIEEHERFEASQTVQLFWVRGRPSDATPAHLLVERLASRGLLLEPFDRVLSGLREAYELHEAESDETEDADVPG